MNFKKQNYLVIKNIINKDLANFLYNYLIIKSNVVFQLKKDNYVANFDEDLGTFGDVQVNDKNSYCCYSDFAMETLLLKIQSKIEEKIKIKLVPNYTYCRLYRKGASLPRHKDRYSCGISGTLNLGGDDWPIFIEPDTSEGSKGKKINLKKGDILIYNGIDCEHWREEFMGDKCGQVFLHYQEITEKSLKNIYDGRPSVGFPLSYFKREEV